MTTTATNQSLINVNLSVFSYIDTNVFVVYAPSLEMYGYGNDETEARHSFDINLQAYFEYTINNHCLQEDLKKYGWKIADNQKAIDVPRLTDLLAKNKLLKDMVNQKSFKKYDLNIQIPAWI
jgi:hypothetical protein